MKLFQRLLVAPAALGLLSPLAANATEVNLNDIANYSDIESIDLANSFDNDQSTKSPLLAGGEGLVDSHDGGFSSTTTASFSVDFLVGAVDGKDVKATGDFAADGDEDIQAAYSFQIDLNTSFTGEDSLDISLDAGNAAGSDAATPSPLLEFDPNTDSDALTVDGVSYTFPLGDSTTVIVGDNTDGSALFTTACIYGGSDTLSNCGAPSAGPTGGGVALGAAYDFGGGYTAAVGMQTSETGVLTKESNDAYGLNLAYTGDSYGASVTYGSFETGTNGVRTDDYLALNAYYTFDSGMSISAGYEVGTLGSVAATQDETLAYFLGIETELGAGTFGAAIGTAGTLTESGGQIEDVMMYEAYYSYPINDGMTITPLVYIKEDTTSANPDDTGIMVKTSFSF